jgi:putative effector of murein hydrolase
LVPELTPLFGKLFVEKVSAVLDYIHRSITAVLLMEISKELGIFIDISKSKVVINGH